MNCNTLVKIDADGKKHYKDKKVYATLDLAIAAAKQINAQDDRISKLVAYKCNYCFKYHIGRNGKEITEKEKYKYKKFVVEKMSFKIVGKIELR